MPIGRIQPGLLANLRRQSGTRTTNTGGVTNVNIFNRTGTSFANGSSGVGSSSGVGGTTSTIDTRVIEKAKEFGLQTTKSLLDALQTLATQSANNTAGTGVSSGGIATNLSNPLGDAFVAQIQSFLTAAPPSPIQSPLFAVSPTLNPPQLSLGYAQSIDSTLTTLSGKRLQLQNGIAQALTDPTRRLDVPSNLQATIDTAALDIQRLTDLPTLQADLLYLQQLATRATDNSIETNERSALQTAFVDTLQRVSALRERSSVGGTAALSDAFLPLSLGGLSVDNVTNATNAVASLNTSIQQTTLRVNDTISRQARLVSDILGQSAEFQRTGQSFDVLTANQLSTEAVALQTARGLVGSMLNLVRRETANDGLSFFLPSEAAFGINVGIATGDFNADRVDDIAVVNTDGQATQLLTNPNGTFTPRDGIQIGTSGTNAFVVGDVDNNGISDIVALNRDTGVLTYNGQTSNVLVGQQITKLRTGDFNKDGFVDLVAGSSTNNTLVLLNDQQNRFFVNAALSGGGSGDIRVADVNNDGNQDVLSGDLFGNIGIFLGDGNSVTETPSRMISTGAAPTSFDVGDINSDGLLDVSVLNTNSNLLETYLQYGGSTTFFRTSSAPIQDNIGSSVRLADLDNDSNLDAVVTGSNGVSILRGDGIAFGVASTLQISGEPNALAIADLNQDRSADIAISLATGGAAAALLSTPSGVIRDFGDSGRLRDNFTRQFNNLGALLNNNNLFFTQPISLSTLGLENLDNTGFSADSIRNLESALGNIDQRIGNTERQIAQNFGILSDEFRTPIVEVSQQANQVKESSQLLYDLEELRAAANQAASAGLSSPELQTNLSAIQERQRILNNRSSRLGSIVPSFNLPVQLGDDLQFVTSLSNIATRAAVEIDKLSQLQNDTLSSQFTTINQFSINNPIIPPPTGVEDIVVNSTLVRDTAAISFLNLQEGLLRSAKSYLVKSFDTTIATLPTFSSTSQANLGELSSAFQSTLQRINQIGISAAPNGQNLFGNTLNTSSMGLSGLSIATQDDALTAQTAITNATNALNQTLFTVSSSVIASPPQLRSDIVDSLRINELAQQQQRALPSLLGDLVSIQQITTRASRTDLTILERNTLSNALVTRINSLSSTIANNTQNQQSLFDDVVTTTELGQLSVADPAIAQSSASAASIFVENAQRKGAFVFGFQAQTLNRVIESANVQTSTGDSGGSGSGFGGNSNNQNQNSNSFDPSSFSPATTGGTGVATGSSFGISSGLSTIDLNRLLTTLQSQRLLGTTSTRTSNVNSNNLIARQNLLALFLK